MRQHLGMALWVAAATTLVVVVPNGGAATAPHERALPVQLETTLSTGSGSTSVVLAARPTKDDKTASGKGSGRTKPEGETEVEPASVTSPETGTTVSPEPVMLIASPFSGASFYVDPHSNARREADALRTADPARAALFDRIGDHAQADWFGDWHPTTDVRQRVADRLAAIRGVNALPVFVVYAIPARDCGGYSAGGLNSPDGYRAWMDEFAAGFDGGPAAVVLEPDAVPQMTTACLGTQQKVDERAALLREAVQTLTSRGVAVYLDAGHSSWLSASEAARRLDAAGIDFARGFALNVSNYRTTTESVSYGRAVSAATGDKPFVVDTSRNGVGPTADSEWCNPAGRAHGPRPAAHPTTAVDAYLWVKRPGESDGECNGGPRAGAWWPEYAEGLASRARW